MRWDNLLADHDDDGVTETAVLPLFPGEAIVRRFKTPQFRGMTFYEVAAKSIINHVPGDRYAFNWTINPYRGCSHACSYCLAGDTPVLMGDGRTKPLADIRPGDEIYGTVKTGTHRRYVATLVSDHWATVKPAYRVTLADGAELVCSGDHRFLTEQGWCHVAEAQFTPGLRLVGTGRLAEEPEHGLEYRRGYIRGLLGRHAAARRDSVVLDLEAEERVRAYLRAGLSLRQVVGGGPVESDWVPVTEARGFLAGIFDAAGTFSDAIRIASPDPSEMDQVGRCLDALGFFAWRWDEDDGHSCVCLPGGMAAALEFFLAVDPAISRKRNMEGVAVDPLAGPPVETVEPLGIEMPLHDITTGTGDFIANGVVSHNCFARPTHTYLEFDAGRDFETRIVVKINAADLLRRELRRKSWKGDLIAMGTNTDPYQRAEGHYKLMRAILTELNAARNPYSILTKGTLIQRDLDLLVEGASVTEVSANFSVGTVDEKVWASTEPGTPHPMKRLEVVKMLNAAGIPCGVLMAPILPGISDRPEQLAATVEAAAAAGATHVTPVTLHLRPGVKEEFLPWLAEHYPELVATYGKAYRGSYAPKEVTEPIGRQVAELRRRHGVARIRPTGGRGGAPPPAEEAAEEATEDRPQPPDEAKEQMSLDLGAVPPRKAPTLAPMRGRGK